MIDRAINEETSQNWKEAYEITTQDELSKEAKIIDSHFVFKVKVEEGGKIRLKARLCLHGKKVWMKSLIRIDAVAARSHVIRLILSISTLRGLITKCIDIKGAYMQSELINRELYVRSPRDLRLEQTILWCLTKIPYGIAEAGRQSAKTLGKWMISVAGLKRLAENSKLFVKRNEK